MNGEILSRHRSIGYVTAHDFIGVAWDVYPEAEDVGLVNYPSLVLVFTEGFWLYGDSICPLLVIVVIPVALVGAVFRVGEAGPLGVGGTTGVLDWYHVSIKVNLAIVLWIAGFANCWVNYWRFWSWFGGSRVGDGGAITATGEFSWVNISGESNSGGAMVFAVTTSLFAFN